jgi:hypothetical protein
MIQPLSKGVMALFVFWVIALFVNFHLVAKQIAPKFGM